MQSLVTREPFDREEALMVGPLHGRKVAFVATDGVEQIELTEPRRALDVAGAKTVLVSPKHGMISGWRFGNWADDLPVDVPIAGADPGDYDALVIPGGVLNADRLRTIPEVVRFVEGFVARVRPIAAICHAPWVLIEAGGVRGRRLTSWPSLRTDLLNAGSEWFDEEVIVDRNLVTSRRPSDIPAFVAKAIEVIVKAEPRGIEAVAPPPLG
jgi:protease I